MRIERSGLRKALEDDYGLPFSLIEEQLLIERFDQYESFWYDVMLLHIALKQLNKGASEFHLNPKLQKKIERPLEQKAIFSLQMMQKLCEVREFNLETALVAIDASGTGEVPAEALVKALKGENIVLGSTETDILCATYDVSGRGNIRYDYLLEDQLRSKPGAPVGF